MDKIIESFADYKQPAVNLKIAYEKAYEYAKDQPYILFVKRQMGEFR